MRKLLIGILAALGMAAPVNASVIISEDFENGFGVFTPGTIAPGGQVGIATGADYQVCCGPIGNTTNHFVAFGSGNQPSGTITSSPFSTVLNQTYTVTLDY